MKKNILLVFAIVLSANVFAQSFDVSKLRAGAGLVYATEVSNVGINLNGVYSFTDQWEGSLGFTHIFEKDYLTYNMLDFDVHYVFYTPDEKLNVYGLAGLGFTFWDIDSPTIYISDYTGFDFGMSATSALISTPNASMSGNGTDLGLNLGVGANYKLSDKLNLAPEIRLTVTDNTYLRIGATLQYRF